MKKLFALLAVAIGVVACQKDQADFGVNLGGEQEAFITVNLPEVSRAGSEFGAFENGVLNTHDLRYILEIYYGENCYRQVQYTNEKSASFPVRLAPGRAYNFVVWADFVEKDNHADLFYKTSDGLDEISILNGAPMTEARDAFYGNYTLAADAHVANMGAITLTRPFAKVRVVTTDVQDLNNLGVALPTNATVTYKTTINNKFNALPLEEGETRASSDANAVKTYTFNYANTYAVENGEMTLFADYLFVNANATTQFDLTVTNHVAKSFNTDIPVVANQVTTIKGDILTNGSDIKVEINDNLAAETIYLEGNVTLTENLNVNRPLVVAAGKTAVLNLNGKKIINTNPSENYGEGEGIVVYGNLTIEGEGTIQGTSMAVWARGGNGNAVVTIKGGTFVGCGADLEGGRSVVYASSGNVVNIYGGEFKAEAADETSFATTQYPVLNVADNNGMINVYGGRFYKQNPAAPGTEPADWNAAHPNGFLAEGYVSVANGEWFDVIYDPYYGYTKVNNADELAVALGKATVEKIVLFAGNYGTIVAQSNKLIEGTPEAKVDCVNLNGANNLTLKNINFDAAKATMAYGGDNKTRFMANIFSRNQTNAKTVNGAHNLVIDGCIFTGAFANGGVVICFADQTKAGSGNITIKNCVFDTVANGTYASIYGYYFGDGSNGHDELIIKDNIFKTDYLNNCFPAYLGKYASSTPVVVKNNVFENVSTLDNAVRLQDHSNYGVSINASNNTFAN